MFDVMAATADPVYAESFRSLRTNLYRALPGEHGKVALVTSPSSGDGKTMCALSLAAMLAADNRRVLVIDADVRQPSHHLLLGVPESPGLRELILQAPGASKSAIRTLCLSVGYLDAISCGSGASAELLSAPNFAAFLVDARSHYDFILLDSPSYPAVSDPLVLAPLSDFVLSVLRLGNTPRRLAEDHLAGIFDVARGYAVVVNNAEPATRRGGVAKAPASLASAFRRTPN
jgi:Mrp family chromosome partitioning ATPase